jgi:hypothetical protein
MPGSNNAELERMRQRIRELEDELKRQREQYTRRSSVAPTQNDAELER